MRGSRSFSFKPRKYPGIGCTVVDAATAAFITPPATASNADVSSQSISHDHSQKYPILSPLLPHVAAFLSESEAQSIFALYLSSHQSTTYPYNTHIPAFVFRRSSLLSSEGPRKCKPALLASMLWIATSVVTPSNLELEGWSPSTHLAIRQRLGEVTINLLQPLDDPDSQFLQESSVTYDRQQLAQYWTGILDDIMTYVHIAIVTGSVVGEVAAIKWWEAALNLAKESCLYEESEFSDACQKSLQLFEQRTLERIDIMRSSNYRTAMFEECKEEKRRVWWLLYIQDRYLSIDHNRPTLLSDAECDGLLLPMDEVSWQTGSFLSNGVRFPSLKSTGPGMYGWLVPLMTITSTLLTYVNSQRHHTLFDIGANHEELRQSILGQLEEFFESVVQYKPQQHSLLDCHNKSYVSNDMVYIENTVLLLKTFLNTGWGHIPLHAAKDLYKATVARAMASANAIAAALPQNSTPL